MECNVLLHPPETVCLFLFLSFRSDVPSPVLYCTAYEQVQVYQFLAVVCHLWWWVESLMFAEGCSEIGMQLGHDL